MQKKEKEAANRLKESNWKKFYDMKRLIFLFISFIMTWNSGDAQSLELKNAYIQVCKTLKEYKFISEDVYSTQSHGQTKSITLKVQNGTLVFLINDDYGAFADPFFGFKHGIKSIKIPLADALCLFYQPSYSKYLWITSNQKNSVEFIYRKQKELIDGYQIHGTVGSLRKLYDELNKFLTLAEEEEFNGSLGVSYVQKTTKKYKKPAKNSAKKNKESKYHNKIGKYVQ